MTTITEKISKYLGFDINGETKKTILTKNQVFATKIFLPYQHAQNVKINGIASEHLGGFFYKFSGRIEPDMVVTYTVGGADFLSKIQSIIDELEALEQKRSGIVNASTSASAIKSKKIEDMSVTFVETSTHVANIEAEEKRLLGLLDFYKNFYVA